MRLINVSTCGRAARGRLEQLRQAVAGSKSCDDAIRTLGRSAQRLGARIAPPGAPFLTADEIRLLKQLSRQARMHAERETVVAEALAQVDGALPRPGTRARAAIDLAQRQGLVPVREVMKLGISRQYLSALCTRGYLRRCRYGFYRSAIGSTKHGVYNP